MFPEFKPNQPRKLDIDLPFNPLDERFLRSSEGREVPPSPGRYLAGACYPAAEDLEGLLEDGQPGTALWACPIVAVPDGGREVLYGRAVHFTEHRRNAHLVAWGPTGVGKSTRVTLPLLLAELRQGNRRLVTVSLKGEEYPLLASWCAASGAELLYVDLSDPARGLGFNPLADVGEAAARDVISAYVDIVVNRNSRDSEFWRQKGTEFMVGAWHAGCHSFPAMLDLFSMNRDEALQRLEASGHPSARAAAAFVRGGSHNADTVLATVTGWLSPFHDPAVRATTGTHELDGAALFRRPGVLAIRCPEPRLSTLRPVYNLLIQWLVDAAIATADEGADGPARPSVSFTIEDLPAWGAVPHLVDRLATLRGRRISITAAVQSMAQLRHAYGEAAEAVEKAFVNKVVLPGVDQADAEYFARCTGEQQVVVSADGGGVMDGAVVSRHVLAASDIRAPRWRHFLLGQPATFVLQDVAFQAYLCPLYLIPEALAILPPPGHPGPKPPARPTPLIAPAIVTTVQAGGARFTNTKNMSPEQLEERIASARDTLGWQETTGSARKWWESFESENKHRRPLVLRLIEELQHRKATVTEFFLAYVYSNTDNIQANLSYLDYTRLKKEEERKKKEAARQAAEEAARKKAEEGQG